MSALPLLAFALLAGGEVLLTPASSGRWNARADGAPLSRFLETLEREAGLPVVRGAAPSSDATITLTLEDRPLATILDYALGSVGLAAERTPEGLALREAAPDLRLDADHALEVVAERWRACLERFPGAAEAAEARLALGELALFEGEVHAAEAHLREAFLEGGVAALEAGLRLGRLLEARGAWSEAENVYEHVATARDGARRRLATLGQARCATAQGRPAEAEELLAGLSTSEGLEPLTRTERELVRVEAATASGAHEAALALLERRVADIDPLAESEVWRLRAENLELLARPGEASRSWVRHARSAHGARAAHGVERAARLGLAGGDLLGALFACREGLGLGLEDELFDVALETRKRIGLAPPESPRTPERRLRAAELRLERGEADEADELLVPLFGGLEDLEPELAVRAAVLWADVAGARQGAEAGLDVLRRARARVADAGARTRIDLELARRHEALGQWEAALEARLEDAQPEGAPARPEGATGAGEVR